MPYAKGGDAEKLAKMRKSLRGRAKTLERQISRGKYAAKDIPAIRAEVDHLRKEASELYATEKVDGKRTRKSAGEIQKAITQGRIATERVKIDVSSGQGRRNLVTQTEINRAGTPLSSYDKEDAQTFYRLTMDIWKGSTGNRNDLIMDALGVSDLEIAFELVEAAKMGFLDTEEVGGIGVASDEAPELSEKGSGEKKGSPPAFAAYTYFDSSNIIDYMFDDDIMEVFARHKNIMSREEVKEWFATYRQYDDSQIEELLSEKYDNE